MSYSTNIWSFQSVFIQIWSLCQKVTEVLLLLIPIFSIKDHTGALLLIDGGNRSRVQVAIFRPVSITGVPNLPLCNTFQFSCIIWIVILQSDTQVLTLCVITSLSGAALHLFLLLLFLLFFRFFPGLSFLCGVSLSSPFNAFWWVKKEQQNNSRVTEESKKVNGIISAA